VTYWDYVSESCGARTRGLTQINSCVCVCFAKHCHSHILGQRNDIQANDSRDSIACPVPKCRVLPPVKFNGIIHLFQKFHHIGCIVWYNKV